MSNEERADDLIDGYGHGATSNSLAVSTEERRAVYVCGVLSVRSRKDTASGVHPFAHTKNRSSVVSQNTAQIQTPRPTGNHHENLFLNLVFYEEHTESEPSKRERAQQILISFDLDGGVERLETSRVAHSIPPPHGQLLFV